MRLVTLGLLGLLLGCVEDQLSSRSYKGHENDVDANNLVGVYPSLVGTRLDDCQTCHTSRIEAGRLAGSACDHCHDLLLNGTAQNALETLNGFGRDYLDAGRNRSALEGIRQEDSDGDGFSNELEISAGRDPGSRLSMPGQADAPTLTLALDELETLPSHTQFLLVNNTQQRFDDYATYRGVTVRDLFEAYDIDLAGATGITVFAPDGYQRSLPIEFVTGPFPAPLFYSGLDTETLGPDWGVVRYPRAIPDGAADGSPIPGEHWLLLAYERGGLPMEPSGLDVAEGKLVGEGPLRIVVPQERPGKPDRGSRFSPTGCGDGLDFREDADHNAGSMVRGVVALRIDPLPTGVEDFEYRTGGWALLDAGTLILYGHGVR